MPGWVGLGDFKSANRVLPPRCSQSSVSILLPRSSHHCHLGGSHRVFGSCGRLLPASLGHRWKCPIARRKVSWLVSLGCKCGRLVRVWVFVCCSCCFQWPAFQHSVIFGPCDGSHAPAHITRISLCVWCHLQQCHLRLSRAHVVCTTVRACVGLGWHPWPASTHMLSCSAHASGHCCFHVVGCSLRLTCLACERRSLHQQGLGHSCKQPLLTASFSRLEESACRSAFWVSRHTC